MAIPAKWINHIEQWQKSGLEQTVYCQHENLNVRTFTARLSEYRKAQQGSAPDLIPVHVKKTQTPASADSIVFIHRNGHRLALPVSVSASWLAELLQCLD
jgi:hypothetical protein